MGGDDVDGDDGGDGCKRNDGDVVEDDNEEVFDYVVDDIGDDDNHDDGSNNVNFDMNNYGHYDGRDVYDENEDDDDDTNDDDVTNYDVDSFK